MKLYYAFENIRSIESMASVELGPITVVVGANNSGKSSFVRSFPLLCQSIEADTSVPVSWKGKYIDYGGFKSAVRKQEVNENIAFNFEIQDLDISCDYNRYFYGGLFSERKTDFSHKITCSSIKFSIVLGDHKGQTVRKKISVEIASEDIKSGNNLIKGTFYFSEPTKNGSNENIIEGIEMDGKNISNILDNNTLIYDMSNIFPQLLIVDNDDIKNKEFFYPDNDKFLELMHDCLMKLETESADDTIDDNIVLAAAHDAYELLRNPRLSKDIIARYTNDKDRIQINKLSKMMDGNEGTDLFETIDRLCSLNWIFEALNKAGIIFSDVFRNCIYIGPSRVPFERNYQFQEFEGSKIASDGSDLEKYIASLEDRGLFDEFSNWIERFLSIKMKVVRNNGTLSLCIANDETVVNVVDSGFGISQILPIITQFWILSQEEFAESSRRVFNRSRSNFRLVTIEQPEVHLHPGHQAVIADAVVQTIKKMKTNGLVPIFIIETHSEVFINKLGDLIEYNGLSSEDVQILMFSNVDRNTAKITKSCFNVKGELDSEWPYDFFEY